MNVEADRQDDRDLSAGRARELGLAALQAGRGHEALQLLERLEPSPDAFLWRGLALKLLGKNEDALQAFAEASRRAPKSGVPYAESAKICSEQGDPSTAMTFATRANQLDGESEVMDFIVGTSLYELGRPLDALNVAAHMSMRWPSSTAAFNLRGGVLRSVGRIDEAVEAFDRALEIDPTYGAAAYNRYSLRAPRPNDNALDKLRAASSSSTVAFDENGVLAEYGLGCAEEALGNYDTAFAHFRAGAAQFRKKIQYDEAEMLGQLESTMAVFSDALVRDKSGAGAPSREHIFVVGMPRSGTTLVEQILASHREVTTAGEISDLARSVASTAKDKGSAFPEFVSNLEGRDLERLGYLYSSTVKARHPQASRILDKMPSNFLLIGLIHLALPNAKIIHCRRDPLDTSVSIFTHFFAKGISYSYDLAELGRYYRGYQRLMDHWRSVLPSGALLDVDYESLVKDPETTSRRIVDYCSLEWDQRCLEFYNSARQVRTASAAEVRRPIYNTAIGSAHKYDAFLEPLREALSR